MDLLVLAPTAPDLRGLHQTLGERIDGTIHGLHVSGKVVGVGMPASAASASKRVFQLQPRAVVLLGTCGVYPERDYQPMDVVVGSEVTLLDHTIAHGAGRFPGPMVTKLASHAAMTAGLASTRPRARAAPVASPLSQTRDDQLVSQVRTTYEAHVEHLEAFSIATACHLANVPFSAVLSITHVVGSYGDDDWRRFQRDATLAAAELVVSWVYAGAPGLPSAR